MKNFVLMIYTYDDINLSQVPKPNGVETRIISLDRKTSETQPKSGKVMLTIFGGLPSFTVLLICPRQIFTCWAHKRILAREEI